MNQVNHGKPMSRQQKWQIAMHAKGLCKVCAQPAVTKWLCLKHATAHNRRNNAFAAQRRAAGLCPRCGRPTDGKYLCDTHHAKFIAYQQARNRRLKTRPNPTEPVK